MRDTRPAVLSDEQLRWIESARAEVSVTELVALVSDMTNIPSPTGDEADLARYVAEYTRANGLSANVQALDARQANAVARYGSIGDGPDLLLYAPLDTLTTGVAEEDVPWIGPELRPDMQPRANRRGDWVVGLGASNPKGHAACVIAAAIAVARAGVPLRGSLVVGLGAGGMPTNSIDVSEGARRNTGQGVGCSFMLEQGTHADYAIIAKPGWTVDHEEVGLCWFRVRVRGTFSYVGSRHRITYKNPIVETTKLIGYLEEWFPKYSHANTSGLVSPQANIGWIRSGWSRTASLSPAACELMIDLRVSPRTTPMDVKRQFQAALDDIRARCPEIDADFEMVLAIPGTSTARDSWIVQSCTRAWEAIEKRPHELAQNTSGATDANILRHRGIPTARVGMPKVADPDGNEVDFPMGMNAVDPRAMETLTHLLIRTTVDTCTRPRGEIGIS